MIARRLSWAAALLAGMTTLVIAILISADVLLRYFLNSPLLFVDEVASFLLVLVIFGGLAYTFVSHGYVRVDLVITPPVGLNLFVIQGLMPGSTARDVTVGTTPFVLLLILMVVLLFIFPELVLWLPRQMMAR